jgi:Kef-type K+ transport system membrane component KefB
MELTDQLLMTVGGILLLGLATSALGHRTILPRATLLLVFGVLIGEHGFDLIPAVFVGWFEEVASVTLILVGFLLGGKLTRDTLGDETGAVLSISIIVAVVVALVVSLGLAWAGLPLALAILLGCVASATDPAAVLDVVDEHGRDSRFGELLLAIVALDDIWALLLFSIGLALVSSLNGAGPDTSHLLMAAWEIFGACALGIALGFPAAYLTGRLKPGQPIVSEALGLVFLCGGLALWLGVSYVISSMVLGAMVANLARHHEYPFHAIEGIEQQFMVVFFILAGAALEVSALPALGLVGLLYIALRAAGKLAGGKLGSVLSRSDSATGNWMGVALMPQAGVAIGLALVASNEFPEYRQILLPLVISSTVLFEIVGPIFTRLAIERSERAAPR